MSLALGVHVGQQNLTMLAMRKLWKDLDEARVDWISAWDHFYEAPPANGTQDHFEALTTLGALAADTQYARIGCLVFYVGYRNPASLAKAAATLDHISSGRFELGLGAGWHEQEARAYGYDFPPIGTRLDMLEEAAIIIRQMLSKDRTNFSGQHFSVNDAANQPAPLQPRMPIWIGGLGEKKTLRIVAQQADGWNAAYISPKKFDRLNQTLNQWCIKSDRDPNSIKRSVNLSFNLALTDKDILREKDRIKKQWGPGADRIISGALLCKPEAAIEKLLEYHHRGADMINIAIRAPYHEETLRAYLDVVIPAVRAAAL
ncbi:MAG: LLM class flavin-dependent oxidoreductase [Gammaproteobacteria bacterium]|nr:LLM class flavin-dependent oxidoreductase [Gammaproteobacteria bacterium]